MKWNFLRNFSFAEKIFILCAMFSGFCISAEYAVIRPVSNSVFLTAYGSEWFPYAWLAIIPINFLIVSLYNRFLPKLGCRKMFLASALIITAGNLFCAVFMKSFTFLPFLFYLWKEVYVLLMFQQLWSVIHTTVSSDRAKYLYGLIFAVGGAGGALGSFFPGFFALQLGSENLIFATLPIYAVLTLTYLLMLKYSQALPKSEWEGADRSLMQGVRLIAGSRPLIFIMLIVVFMQIVSTLIYYQFNVALEASVGDLDLRTEYCGRVLGITNILTVVLQLIGSFVFVHFMGLRNSHLFVPCSLFANAALCFLFPTFPMISMALITVKAFDFSIFGVIKEMLYIPLKLDEKFRAKAVIDVFAYRTAKAGAAILILCFQALTVPFAHLSWGTMALCFVWLFLVYRTFKLTKEPAIS